MKALVASTLACLGLTSLATAAHADDPIVTVVSSKVDNCNTDGGSVKCSEGSQLIAKGLRTTIDELRATCAGAKPGKYKVTLTFEYNGGEIFYLSHVFAASKLNADNQTHTFTVTPLTDESTLTDNFDGKPLKKKPGLPACLRENVLPKASENILRWLDLIMPLDPEVDVRSDFVLNLSVAPAKE